MRKIIMLITVVAVMGASTSAFASEEESGAADRASVVEKGSGE